MKVLTFSSRPQTACFHVVNGQRTAVVNRKLDKYADELSCHASHTMNFAVVSHQPSCCVRSLMSSQTVPLRTTLTRTIVPYLIVWLLPLERSRMNYSGFTFVTAQVTIICDCNDQH